MFGLERDKADLTDTDLEPLLLEYAERCSATGGECPGCPLFADENDKTCAWYLMDAIRRPGAYEMRGGLLRPKGGAA